MKKGFSLLEVVLALALFAIVVYCLYPIYYTVVKEVQLGHREDQVLEIAKNVYEKRRAGQVPEMKYRVQGQNYQLEEKVVQEKEEWIKLEWTLKGGDHEKTWTALIPKEGVYTP